MGTAMRTTRTRRTPAGVNLLLADFGVPELEKFIEENEIEPEE